MIHPPAHKRVVAAREEVGKAHCGTEEANRG